MKVGGESRTKVWIMVALLVAAGLLLARNTGVFAGNQAPAPAAKAEKKPAPVLNNLDPRLQLALLQASEQRTYDAGKRNIFQTAEEQTPVIPQPKNPARPNPGPQVEPGPPPIALKFFGFANVPGEPKKVFLSSGDEVFIGAEGDIVDRRYKIVKIGTASVEIEDMLNNNRQTIPLSQG